eukprot:7140556-Prymnesium_polylepis.1
MSPPRRLPWWWGARGPGVSEHQAKGWGERVSLRVGARGWGKASASGEGWRHVARRWALTSP